MDIKRRSHGQYTVLSVLFEIGCRAVQIEIGDSSTWPVGFLSRTEAASCAVPGFQCWFLNRLDTGWKYQETNLRLDKFIQRINRSINEVPRSMSTAKSRWRRVRLWHKEDSKQTLWRILPSICRRCLVAVLSFENGFCSMQCCHGSRSNRSASTRLGSQVFEQLCGGSGLCSRRASACVPLLSNLPPETLRCVRTARPRYHVWTMKMFGDCYWSCGCYQNGGSRLKVSIDGNGRSFILYVPCV